MCALFFSQDLHLSLHMHSTLPSFETLLMQGVAHMGISLLRQQLQPLIQDRRLLLCIRHSVARSRGSIRVNLHKREHFRND